MVTKTIQSREANNIIRKDLMQYLIQLRNNSSTAIDEWKIKTSGMGYLFDKHMKTMLRSDESLHALFALI
jgi:hypothetical protein